MFAATSRDLVLGGGNGGFLAPLEFAAVGNDNLGLWTVFAVDGDFGHAVEDV